jgi:integrase
MKGRPATGTVKYEGGHWKARITVRDGSRPWIDLPYTDPKDEAKARSKAVELSMLARDQGSEVLLNPRIVDGERVRDYAVRWLDWRTECAVASVKDDRTRLARHVFPVVLADGTKLGDRPIVAVTRADLEDLVDALDEKVRKGSYLEAGGRRRSFGWKTATLTWSNVSTLFTDAREAKPRALRVREDNPADGVAGPDRGVIKSKNYLYPSEFLALVRCERVPVERRRLYAIAVYLYERAGELEGQAREDIDLEHRAVHVHQAVDRVRNPGEVKSTKGRRARRVPTEQEIEPLLRAMLRTGKRGPLLDMPGVGTMSENLRADLRTAGVTRADLFTRSKTRKPITFHDLRATGITWMAVRGDDPLTIMARAGHVEFKTTLGYIREAENLSAGFGDVFPALPESLLSSGLLAGLAGETENSSRFLVGVTGFEPVTEGSATSPLDVSGAEDPLSTTSRDGSGRTSGTSPDLDLPPAIAAELARDASIAVGVLRCVRLAKAQDRQGTLAEMRHVVALLAGGAS